MALPPTIPTSFVPYSASAAPRKFRADYTSAFSFFAYGVLGIAVILAIGVFAYGRILATSKAAKDAALAQAESGIDTATVESFVRLRNRLTSSAQLLDGHPSVSNFLTTFGQLLPANVRLTSLHITLAAGSSAKLDAAGIARSFNALAALSNALATDGRFKDAIFSNIVVSPKNNSVAFAFTTSLDPKLVAFTASSGNAAAPSTAPAAAPAATTTSGL